MSSTPVRWLDTRIPPPIVMLLLGVLAFGAARALPLLSFELPQRIPLALLFAFAGVALNLLPKLAFKRAGTTVNPLRVDAATSLVTSGIYRYTRNPMYLGHAVILLGFALYLAHPAALLAVPTYVAYVSRFQIAPEERSLAARFPAGFAAFCRQARRWL